MSKLNNFCPFYVSFLIAAVLTSIEHKYQFPLLSTKCIRSINVKIDENAIFKQTFFSEN